MTNENGNDRLDRMEALLSETIKGLVETRKVAESNNQAIAKTLKIAESNNQAIAETRKITESNNQAIAETRKIAESNNQAIAETRKIAESNGQAIQSMLDQRVTDRLEHEERMKKLEEILDRVTKTQNGLSKMYVKLDEDRPTILRKLNTIENKVDKLDNLERIENKIDRIIEEK